VIGNTLLTPAIASLAASTLLTAFSGPQQHENRQEQKNKKESDGGGHGSKGGGGSSRLRSTNNKLKPAPLACLSQSFTNGHSQSSALLHCTTFSLGPASSWAVRRACAMLQAISSMQPLVVAMVYHSGLFAELLMVWGSILGEQCLQSRKCGA
jgi:hypothetical protein